MFMAVKAFSGLAVILPRCVFVMFAFLCVKLGNLLLQHAANQKHAVKNRRQREDYAKPGKSLRLTIPVRTNADATALTIINPNMIFVSLVIQSNSC